MIVTQEYLKFLKYRVRYAMVPARNIYNLAGPNSLDIYNVPDSEKPKKHLNTEAYVQTWDQHQNGFFSKLEKSILSEGIRNPIIVDCGNTDPETKKRLPQTVTNTKNYMTCWFLGGSRLWIAQKHNLQVKCIVNDFNNCFSELPIEDVTNNAKLFSNPPKKIWFDLWGIKTSVPMDQKYKREKK